MLSMPPNFFSHFQNINNTRVDTLGVYFMSKRTMFGCPKLRKSYFENFKLPNPWPLSNASMYDVHREKIA